MFACACSRTIKKNSHAPYNQTTQSLYLSLTHSLAVNSDEVHATRTRKPTHYAHTTTHRISSYGLLFDTQMKLIQLLSKRNSLRNLINYKPYWLFSATQRLINLRRWLKNLCSRKIALQLSNICLPFACQ